MRKWSDQHYVRKSQRVSENQSPAPFYRPHASHSDSVHPLNLHHSRKES